jgi:hypothetical protein
LTTYTKPGSAGWPIHRDSDAVVELAIQVLRRPAGGLSFRLIRRTKAAATIYGTVTCEATTVPVPVVEDMVSQLWRRLLEDIPLVDSGQLALFIGRDTDGGAPAVPVR